MTIIVPDWAIGLFLLIWIVRGFFRLMIRLGDHLDRVEPLKEPGKNPAPSSPRPEGPVPPMVRDR